MSAALENIEEADDVAIRVGVRIGKRVTHASLCCQVDYFINPLSREKSEHDVTFSQIDPAEREVRLACQAIQSCLLQSRIVIGVEVVNANNCVAAIKETMRDVRSDESCSSCEENHCHLLGGNWYGGNQLGC